MSSMLQLESTINDRYEALGLGYEYNEDYAELIFDKIDEHTDLLRDLPVKPVRKLMNRDNEWHVNFAIVLSTDDWDTKDLFLRNLDKYAERIGRLYRSFSERFGDLMDIIPYQVGWERDMINGVIPVIGFLGKVRSYFGVSQSTLLDTMFHDMHGYWCKPSSEGLLFESSRSSSILLCSWEQVRKACASNHSIREVLDELEFVGEVQ